MRTTIDLGDTVYFQVTESLSFIGTVAWYPTQPGEDWIIVDTIGNIIQIKNYLYIRRLKNETKG